MNQISYGRRLVGQAIIAIAVTIPVVVPLHAAEPRSERMEEVVVTARKRKERLQDIPGSASALSEAMIEDIGGVYNLRDVTDMIPGITIVEAASSDLMEPSIRGAGQARNRSSVSATGFYRNGAYFASQSLGGRSFARMDTYDVQQIEVLRGPQGALYGRNALGGAMNIISKRPGDALDFVLGVKGGEKEFQSIEGIANVPINEMLNARISYLHDERDDGFYKDQSNNPVDVSEFEHLRLGLLFKPSEELDIYYSYDVSEDNYSPGVRQRRRDTQTDLRATLVNSPNFGVHDIDNHALTIDYKLPRGVLTSVTNYRKRDLFRQVDSDQHLANLRTASSATRMDQNFVDAEVLFQEFRFISNLGGAFEYLVGADYYGLETRELRDSFVAGGQTTRASSIRDWNVDQTAWAAYGSVDYDFENLPLSVSAELRYARDDIDGRVLTIQPNLGNRVLLDSSGENKYTNLPWGVSLAWRFENVGGPISEAQSYFKVGSSYRHGGINLGAGLPSDAFPVKPVYDEEDSISYEIGVKSAWFDGALKLNVATFMAIYQNFLNTTNNGCPELCPFLDPVTGGSLGFDASGAAILVNSAGEAGLESDTAFFIDNTGEIEAWGVEVEASFDVPITKIGGRLLGNVGWSRQMGEVKEISSNVSPANAELKGERLNYMRPVELKGRLTWRQPLSYRNLMLNTTLVYTHENGGIRSIGSSLSLDGVDRLDARIGLESDHWSLTLNGNNLLDNEYFSDRTKTRFRLADPRYYFVELSWKYR